jgi:hypothetical protein
VNNAVSNPNSVWGSNTSGAKETEKSPINLSVYLGNELLTKKVIEAVNSEVTID